MIKKIVIVLTLALMLTLGATLSFAQMQNFGQISPEAIEELKKEPAMTQADVAAYIKILPDLGKAMTDQNVMAAMVKDSGLSEARLGMVMTKVSLAQALTMGMTMEQLNTNLNAGQIPEVMKPTDADIALVRNNMEEINAAMLQMQQRMQSK